LSGERELIRTYYYNAPLTQEQGLDQYIGQQKFLSRLYSTPYLTVKLGYFLEAERPTKIVCQYCSKEGSYLLKNWTEKGVDTKIATDMLSMAYKNIYDTAILVSGDGDFASTIEAVKELGKHVEVAFCGTPYHLQKVCDRFILLTRDFLKPCLL
jgi:uncharacterized LabA/DUF88 family protein